MKSKKILLNLKHFYKINSKFDRMREFKPKDPMTQLDQKVQLNKVDESVQLIEESFAKLNARTLKKRYEDVKTKNRWVQTTTSPARSKSREVSPETAYTQQT